MESIVQQRKKQNLSQEDLANALGLSRPTYDSREKGRTRFTIEEAIKLYELGINIFPDDLKPQKFHLVKHKIEAAMMIASQIHYSDTDATKDIDTWSSTIAREILDALE